MSFWIFICSFTLSYTFFSISPWFAYTNRRTYTYLDGNTHFANTIIIIFWVYHRPCLTPVHIEHWMCLIEAFIYRLFSYSSTLCCWHSETARKVATAAARSWREQPCKGKFELTSFQCFSMKKPPLAIPYFISANPF